VWRLERLGTAHCEGNSCYVNEFSAKMIEPLMLEVRALLHPSSLHSTMFVVPDIDCMHLEDLKECICNPLGSSKGIVTAPDDLRVTTGLDGSMPEQEPELGGSTTSTGRTASKNQPGDKSSPNSVNDITASEVEALPTSPSAVKQDRPQDTDALLPSQGESNKPHMLQPEKSQQAKPPVLGPEAYAWVGYTSDNVLKFLQHSPRVVAPETEADLEHRQLAIWGLAHEFYPSSQRPNCRHLVANGEECM
jgi:hypothetical protein